MEEPSQYARKRLEHLETYDQLLAEARALVDQWAGDPAIRTTGYLQVVKPGDAHDPLKYQVRVLNECFELLYRFVWLRSSKQIGIQLWVRDTPETDGAPEKALASVTIGSGKKAAVTPHSRELDHDISTTEGAAKAGKAFLDDLALNVLIRLPESLY